MASCAKHNYIIHVHIRSQKETCEKLCIASACLLAAKYYRVCKCLRSCVVFTMMN